jgi:single-strand DNA-binding protein
MKMAGLNKCTFIGRLGADPEARSLQNGGEVVSLRLAVSESWKTQQGERKERTEWISVVIFNEGLGKVAKQYLRKGSQCFIEGKLQTRKWQDQSGNDRYSTEVVLQKFQGELVLLDSKQGDSGGFSERSERGGQGGTGFNSSADLDDDVPFVTNDPALEYRVL